MYQSTRCLPIHHTWWTIWYQLVIKIGSKRIESDWHVHHYTSLCPILHNCRLYLNSKYVLKCLFWMTLTPKTRFFNFPKVVYIATQYSSSFPWSFHWLYTMRIEKYLCEHHIFDIRFSVWREGGEWRVVYSSYTILIFFPDTIFLYSHMRVCDQVLWTRLRLKDWLS